MKNFLITVLLVAGIFYLLGEISQWFFVFHLSDMDFIDPLIGALIVCGIAGALMLLGFLLAVSLFGALVIGFGAAIFSVFMVGVHLFWPILFIILIIYLLADKRKSA